MVGMFHIHVRTVTGLEEVLAKELIDLGAQSVEPKSRLVTCVGNLVTLYQANLFCRTAIRVLRPLAAFPAREEKDLYQGIRAIAWNEWLSPEGTLAVDADVRSSFTTHSLFVSQLTKDAVVDLFRDKTGKRPSVDLENPDIKIVVSLFQDEAQVYLDASGESLHKRGYRRRSGQAPVSETLAAGILKITKWDGSVPLVDPMCGSGTFLIEAGLLLKNIVPGLIRNQYGFQKWPDYDKAIYEELISQAQKEVRSEAEATLIGIDKDPEMVEIARQNIALAGLQSVIRVETGDFFTWKGIPDKKGILILNPPYDERLPIDNVAELYQKIGDQLKQCYGGWSAHVLCGNLEAAKYIGLRSSQRTLLYNGSIEARLLKFELLPPKEGETQLPKWRQSPTDNPKWIQRAEIFGNRIRKNFKHLSKWAKREGVTCWRVYDWDIPELAFFLDIYEDRLHFSELERNQEHGALEHPRYVQLMLKTASEALKIPSDKIYFKKRKPQKSGGFQYAPHAETGEFIEVKEGGHRFLVNLADYLDVGLFLDHRRTRAMVEKEARGKDFLNLFAYTGSFSVYAAAGGAKSTMTVDTSHSYLDWARRNLYLNGFTGSQHQGVRSDSFEFLHQTSMRFDLCVVDPPTRSVNKSSERVFEVQQDHVHLLRLVIERMRPGGKIFFSTNYRTFTFDESGVKANRKLKVTEITPKTISPDFEHHPSHRCWLIELNY